MLPRRTQALALLFATTLLGHASSLSAQDFDPAGRRRRPPSTSPSPRPRPSAPRAPQRPAEPTKDALIARYMGIVLAQPGVPFPLERLAQLYRERDGHLKQLVVDLEERVAKADKDSFAAKLALAGAFRLDGRIDDALRAYETAIEERPKHPAPLLALAELHRQNGDLESAQARYRQALPLLPQAEKEQALRTLLTLALDLGDFEAAKRYHQELVRGSQGSLFARSELSRELMARGAYERAEVELRALVTAASGDNRTLVPALRDLGKALSQQGKSAEAIPTLERALALSGTQSGLRREILDLVVDAYRQKGDLAALVARLEAERGRDEFALIKLGEIYEEMGRVDEALSAYERAARANAKSIETRLKIIHLLHAKGELERATREYEALIRIAPHEPDYVFELSDTLIQRGEREKALAKLSEVERRLAKDESTLARLVDYYERIDEKPRARALLQKLAASSTRDPSHLIELGDRYWQEGDKKRALDTWARIRNIVPQRARALGILGEVYLDHDMPNEALEAFKEAMSLEPSVAHRKAYAMALERVATVDNPALAMQRYEEARLVWEGLLESAGADRNLAREARTHIVMLFALSRQLHAQVPKLERRLAGDPKDLETGRLLTEALIRLRKLPEAEKTLRRLIPLAPGDAELFLTLERVQVMQRDLEGAIQTLEKLVEIDPRRARELYRRMAEYAAEIYRDEDAVRYAEKAVILSPDDAEGHRKLGDLHRKRQEPERAIVAYRAAILKNDKLFSVYFDLAELLLARGEAEEADRLLRRVLRACPDEDLVTRAARQSIQLNLARGSIESLERELFSIVLGNPRKLILRRLLVELYGDMAFPLVRALRGGTEAEAKEARDKLVELGTRAVKPLLDALGDEREGQQRIAIEVLGFVGNKAAGPALFAFATGQADVALREQAMMACGMLRDPSLLPRFRAFLGGKEAVLLRADPVAGAAAWAVARLGDPKALPLLKSLLQEGSPEARAFAALGLAVLKEQKAVPELVKLARAAETPSALRAALAHSLGELASKETTVLANLAFGDDPLARRVALLALAKLRAKPAKEAIAEALFARDARTRETALHAALVLTNPSRYELPDALAIPEGSLDLVSMLLPPPPNPSPEDGARALLALEPSLASAASFAVMTSPERAGAVADALLARDGKPALAPLTNGLDILPEELRRDAERAAEAIAGATVPGFVALARHPSLELRMRALSFLAIRGEEPARAAILDALADPEESVRWAALGSLRPGVDGETVLRVTEMLAKAEAWSSRSRAAEALGRLAPELSSSLAGPVEAALVKAARDDAFALVREAALSALLALGRERANPVLREASASDPEPRVRERARALLEARPL